MPYRHITYTLLLLLSLLTASCVYDAPAFDDAPGGTTPTVRPAKLSISLRIKAVGDETGSRADYADGELVDGENAEQTIGKNGNFAIFFDANKKFHSVALLDLFTAHEESDYIEKVYTTTIPADDLGSDPYDNLPKYCLVMLNASPYFDKFSGYEAGEATADDILKMVWDGVSDPRTIGRDGELFTMSNSIYFDEKGVKQNLVEINKDMIFDPTNPAHMSLFPQGNEVYPAPVLTVYVERMVSKFTFEIPGKSVNDDGWYLYVPKAQQLVIFNGYRSDGAPTYIARNWAIAVTGWNINGLETKSNVFKVVNDSKYFSDFTWKAPGSFRTYWAEDPHYAGTYPWQYRKALDVVGTINNYEDFKNKGTNQLRNYSFNDLGLDNLDFRKNKVLYSPENTYNYDALKDNLDGRTDVLAGTHLLIGARLLVDNGGGTYMKDQSIYRDRDGFYYLNQKDCYESLLYNFNNLLESQNEMRFTFYNWSGNTTNNNYHGKVYYAHTTGKYTLYCDDKMVNSDVVKSWGADFLAPAQIRGGDGRRMPWPAGNKKLTLHGNGTIQIFTHEKKADGSEVRTLIRYANDDDIKSLLYEWLGAIDHYNQGRMYYASPATIKKGNPDICGVVRNNWFTYSLKDINNLGTPVDDVDQEIIPDPNSNYDQLNITVNILDWHLVKGYAPILP